MVNIETNFDEFIKTYEDGQRLEDYQNGKYAVGVQADYFFEAMGLVLELKSLEKDQANPVTLKERLERALVHYGNDPHLSGAILQGKIKPPENVAKKVETQMGNALRNSLRKANKQIIASSNRLGEKAKYGVLLVANTSDFGFNTYRATHFLAGEALKVSNPAIDAIVVTSPTVDYDEGDGTPTQYWHPVYAEGKEHLGDFIEPFGLAWIKFLARQRDEKAYITPVTEISEKIKYARPIGNSLPNILGPRKQR